MVFLPLLIPPFPFLTRPLLQGLVKETTLQANLQLLKNLEVDITTHTILGGLLRPAIQLKLVEFFTNQANTGEGVGGDRGEGSKEEVWKALISKNKVPWEKLGDPVATNIMSEGLKLYFRKLPELSYFPPPSAKTRESQEILMLEKIPNLLQRNIIREILSPEPLFYSRIFMRPKKNGSLRPIIDLSILNRLLVIPSFKMETISRIAKGLLRILWGCKLDIEDAYLHVPMNWVFHKYLAFKIGKRTFVFQYLPFGLSPAPWAFSRVIKPIKSHLHVIGIWIHSFLDDFLILGESPDILNSSSTEVINTLVSLGFKINQKKSDTTPRKKLEYLGVMLDLEELSLSIPEEKVHHIRRLCRENANKSHISRRQLESLSGTLNFASTYLHLGRLYLIPLMKWMNNRTVPLTRDNLVPTNQEFRNYLKIWENQDFLRSSVPMHLDMPSMTMMTDASQTGWCGVILPHRVWGIWPPSVTNHSMNWKELKTIQLTLTHFSNLVEGETILVCSDNNTAVACLKNQGTLYSNSLLVLTREILEFCSSLEIQLIPKHLKGVLNVLADQGSRDYPIDTEWRIDRNTFLWACRLIPVFPEVDTCSTRDNNHLPVFISPCPDNLAVGMDILTTDLNQWRSIYLFPPVVLIPQLIHQIENFRGRGILIAPAFEASGWFQNLIRRSLGRVQLPPNFSLSQETTQGTVFHPSPSYLNLHAWIL